MRASLYPEPARAWTNSASEEMEPMARFPETVRYSSNDDLAG